ncbi:dihydrofolate reductase family protein [Streptomyces griseoloalbus]|uniref:Dihydrofolate reductase family protein n=1 Tax=Streptomyces griseoloalbus TaxID=67303 RepID=A0ABV3EBA6_9ACTN
MSSPALALTRDDGDDPGTGLSVIETLGHRAAWAEMELAETRAAKALLLGRRSDEWFAARWPSRSGAWAKRLNGLPKYVVSATVQKPEWSSATGCVGKVLKGDVVEEVSALKEELDGDIVVYASIRLAHALLEHDLVDELRLTVFPVVLGTRPAPLRRDEHR